MRRPQGEEKGLSKAKQTEQNKHGGAFQVWLPGRHTHTHNFARVESGQARRKKNYSIKEGFLNEGCYWPAPTANKDS